MVGEAPPQVAFAGEDKGFSSTSRYGHGLGLNWNPGPILLAPTCADLFEIAHAADTHGSFLCLGKGRQKQAGQDGDDGNDHQQLDQGKTEGRSQS